MKSKVCIISGSTLGSTEYVAEHIESVLKKFGFSTALFHGPCFEDIKQQNLWLIVTSTHGAGELPDNLKPLFEQLKDKDSLNISFAIIGIGNSDYDTFCYAVDTIEQILTNKKAKQLCPSLKIDVLDTTDPEQLSENWLFNSIQYFN